MKNRNDHYSSFLFRRVARKYLFILIGAITQGFAMGLFLFPNSIPSGGAGGLTVLFNHWFHIPMSLALFIVNFSMLAVAIHYLGHASTIGTLVAISVTSLAVNFFEANLYMPYDNVWLDMLLGAVFLGLGVGVLLRQGVSHGGMGVLALIIAHSRSINPGKPLFWINGTIFVITAYVIDWHIVFQAIFCQWLSTKIIEWLYSLRISPKLSPSFAWLRK